LRHRLPGLPAATADDPPDEPAVVVDPQPAPHAVPGTFSAIPGLSAVVAPYGAPVSTVVKDPDAIVPTPVAETARRISMDSLVGPKLT
jgi:hypothetical protein